MKQIKKYFKYYKKFVASNEKAIIINDFLQAAKIKGIKHGVLDVLHQRYLRHKLGTSLPQNCLVKENFGFMFSFVESECYDCLISAKNIKDIIILISHDMSRSGAPLLLLNIARELKEKHNKTLILISVVSGELEIEFRKICHVICFNQMHLTHLENIEQVDALFYLLFDNSVKSVLASTIGSCLFVPILEKYNFNYQILVHELPSVIENMSWSMFVLNYLPLINNGTLIYSSSFVLNKHNEIFKLPLNIKIIPQGVFQKVSNTINKFSRIKLRQKYNIPLDSHIILGGGRDVFRKGIDLFYQIAQQVISGDENIYFICLLDYNEFLNLKNILGVNFSQSSNLIFDSFASDYSIYLEGSDIYALTSREDPFPNVMLDSLAHGLPMIAFDNCGGASEVLGKISNALVANYLSVKSFADKIIYLLNNKELYQFISRHSIEVSKSYAFDKYVSSLLRIFPDNEFQPYLVKSSQKSLINRVVHIIGNFNIGGSSQLVVDLMERLTDFHHFVITQYIPHPQKYIGVDIWQIDNNFDDFTKLIQQINPSLIHVHYWGRSDKPWYESIYNRLELFKIPVIQNINVPVQPLISNVNVSYVYVSEFVKKKFGKNNSLGHVIYPGSDFSHFSGRNISELSSAEYVGMVYRLDIDKVNESSIYPFIELCKINDDVKCIIVGDGELLPIYKTIVEQYKFSHRFIFTGYVPYSNLPNIYRKMRIFIAPVFDESFGQVTPFAMSIGMPVVAYNTGALSEIIANDELLATTGDAKKIAQICNDLWNDNKKLEQISEFNQKRAHNNFSIDSMIQRYQSLYLKNNLNIKLRYLFVALNPSAQEGGGADVFWVEAIIYLCKLGLEPNLIVYSRHNLSSTVNQLSALGSKINYFIENGYDQLSSYKPDIVVFIQGDHNEGSEWFEQCYNRKIPYVIVNQLTKEGFWPDDSNANLIREGYQRAHSTFFTCENNRLLIERQLGIKLNNTYRHCNPIIGIERNIIAPFPMVVNDEYHIACPSRLITIHKGQDLLFEVLKQEKWKNRKLILNLYGDGPNKKQLEHLRLHYDLNNVTFCGYVKDIKDIWYKNHGIIMPSRMEGVPIVLLGAMLCARVPILTNVGGHSELVEHGVSGYIAKAPTVELIDEALENAWTNRHKWEIIGINARDSVLEFQSATPVEDFIQKIINVTT